MNNQWIAVDWLIVVGCIAFLVVFIAGGFQ